MLLDEFLVVLGVKADTEKANDFAKSLDKVADGADKTEGSLLRAYDATDGFVSAIEGALGVLGFFTGALGGAFAFFHGTISGLEEMIEEEKLLTKVTKEQIEQSRKYNESVERLGKRYNSLKVEMAMGFLPTMQRAIDAVDNFLASNKDAIVNGVNAFLNAITSTFSVIGNFIKFIDTLIENTIGWKAALIGLVAGLMWVNRAMLIAFATNPVTWVVAAIVGLMLLIDDFMTYLDGGESQFGEFWGAMIEWIDRVKPSLQAVWDALVLGMSYLIEFGAFVTRYFGGALVDAAQIIVAALTMLYALFTGNTELMAAAWDGLVENMISMFQNFASLFEPLAQMLVTIMANVWASIVSAVSERIELIKSFFAELKANFLSVFGSIKNFALSVIMSIASGFNIIASAVVAVASAIIAAFFNGLNVVLSVFDSIKDFASTVVMAIAGLFSIVISAVGSAADRIASLFIAALDVVLSAFAYMKGFALSVITSIASGFNIIVSAVIAVVSAIIGAFFNGLGVVSGAFSSAVDFIASTWSAMTETLSSAFESFIAYFSSIIQSLVSIVSSVWTSIVKTIQERINLIVSAISTFISNLGSMLSGVFDIVTAPFAKAFDWISNKFSSLGGLISGAVSGAGRLFGMGASAATNSTVNNGGNMTVHAPISVTSSDPNKAARLVKSGVTDATNTAFRNMGSRVKA